MGENSHWLRILNPRNRKRSVVALVAVILVLYIFLFNADEKEVDSSRETHNEVLRNLTEKRFQIIHEFCDSFGECFNVEDNYWNKSGRLSVERSITVHSAPGYALTAVKLITPNVLTREYLNPMHWKIDKHFLVARYNSLMAASAFMFGASFSLSLSDHFRRQRVLQIGMGGGSISNYLATIPVNLSIDVVELQSTVYEVAKRFFDLTENERVRVTVADGVKFVDRAARDGIVYDAVLMDACDNSAINDIPCPTAVFRDAQVIEHLSKIVGPSGMLAANMLAMRDREVLEKQIKDLYQKSFAACFRLHFTADHTMLFCSNRKDFEWPANKKEILARLHDYDGKMQTTVHEIVTRHNI